VADALDTDPGGADRFEILELAATAGLVLAIVFEVQFLNELLRRTRAAERNLRVARGALNEVIEEYFRTWALTPAERDVAGFVIKGLSIAEVAALRGAAEGTVKTQLNAIYRKAGVSGRGQLVSLLIDDLLADPLIPAR
jgi:DNA-binding CsgD family transcriptional regulator